MKKSTVKGMNEYLPEEMEIREYLQQKILETYQANGFQRIATPIMEDMENLKKSEGGENLNLLFEVMKRGDKLEKALENGDYSDLADLGLRYDLTLPLSRYYANNKDKLVDPFRCIQIDRVYRAERPQKGRLREFVQCDIDILGTKSIMAEIELILTTTKALKAIGLKDFKVRINDRNILRNVLLSTGFQEDKISSVCITLDKLDKIGIEGVSNELKEKGFEESIREQFIAFLGNQPITVEAVREVCEDTSVTDNVEKIIKTLRDYVNDAEVDISIDYDFTLVRGQGYYTGTIFEIVSDEFSGAIAGGGRYDEMVGKFIGTQVPAVGFSIGFERIYSIMNERGINNTEQRKRIALVYDEDDIKAVLKKADELKMEYNVVMLKKTNNIGKLINKIKQQNFYGVYIMGKSENIEVL